SGNKILIGNLDYGVTEGDLRALFGQIGHVSRATLNHDRNGRSNGTGEVVFKDPSHASMAVKKYHNVELDNRKMKIEMFAQPMQTTPAPSGGNAGRKSGGSNSNTNAQGSKGGRRRGGGRRGGSSSHSDKRPAPTKEELDADLDTYMEG
ncbi:RNA-binding domain-containing protein, partial [Coemansia reversa NRRL 1564]